MKILMYHYIKDEKKDKFKNLKTLKIEDFEYQLKILKKKFNVLAPSEIKFIIKNKLKFSSKDFWLTFDDGYIDHYKNVFPLLEKYHFKGSFFPSVNILRYNKLMDVNVIQLILSKNINPNNILKDIENLIKNYKYDLNYYLKKISYNNRFDNLKIIQVKHLLQYLLPQNIRLKSINYLQKKYLNTKKNNFYKNFYMKFDHLIKLKKSGHEIGMHGFNHTRLNQLSKEKLTKEILDTIKFWKKNNIINKDFTFCYPFGEYNKDAINLLKKSGCLIGLTTKPSSVKLKDYKPLEMPRYDTNDFFKLVR